MDDPHAGCGDIGHASTGDTIVLPASLCRSRSPMPRVVLARRRPAHMRWSFICLVSLVACEPSPTNDREAHREELLRLDESHRFGLSTIICMPMSSRRYVSAIDIGFSPASAARSVRLCARSSIFGPFGLVPICGSFDNQRSVTRKGHNTVIASWLAMSYSGWAVLPETRPDRHMPIPCALRSRNCSAHTSIGPCAIMQPGWRCRSRSNAASRSLP